MSIAMRLTLAGLVRGLRGLAHDLADELEHDGRAMPQLRQRRGESDADHRDLRGGAALQDANERRIVKRVVTEEKDARRS